jgi:uncharacterized protein YPO0396
MMRTSLPQPSESGSASPTCGSASRLDPVRLAREQLEQFRLVRIQSYNWGTFHGLLKLEVSEKGMLFIGPSGSGKSTIFDSHAALLTPPRWLHYNVAARESDTKQDRSALTYIRGVWGEQTAAETGEIAQQQLRPGPTWAAISEVYRNGQGQVITLAHVYWIKGTSNQARDVNKRFIVAERLMELSELEFFPESGFNVRRFKSDLVDAWDTDSFPEYQERMRSRLGIEAENALKLLHKTQSAKNLGSLTDFLRDFMLDEPKTHEMVDQLVSQFERLENAHGEVVSAAKQIAILLPARELNQERLAKMARRNCLEEARAGIDHVANELLRELRVERKEALETRLSTEKARELARSQEVETARTTVGGLKDKRDGVGGRQLADLEMQKQTAESDEAERRQRHDKVAAACRQLGLTVPVDAEKYAEFALQGRRDLNEFTDQAGTSDTRDKLAVQKHELEKQEQTIQVALATLARMPRSKMGPELINIRKVIADGLNIDEAALPYAGELIEVEKVEKGWQGPIERILRGFSRSLLVPEDLYLSVSRFVNQNHLKGRLVYLRMLPQTGRSLVPKSRGLYRKVSVAEGPFQAWVETELLQHFDAECVETPEELQDVQFGITRAGLVKAGGKRHEKDDRSAINDPRSWVLGADTRAQVAALQDQNDQLSRDLDKVGAQLEQLDKKAQQRLARALHWQTMVNFSWEEIDHGAAALRAAQLEAQIKALRAASPDIDILEASISDAEAKLKKAEEAKKAQDLKTAEVQVKLNQVLENIEKDALVPAVAPTPLQRTAVRDRLEAGGREPTIESIADDMRFVDRELGKEIGVLDTEAAKLLSKIEQKFADYNRLFEAESGGLDPTMASFDEYDAKLTRLQVDDLPRFEAKFKELLNEQSNQHVALLSNQLEQERKEISDRMDTVNDSLLRAEYNKGTHLLIEVEEKAPPEAQELKAELRAALSHSLSMDDRVAEARFQAMKKLVKRLASQDPQQISWRRLALDVRQHVEFLARELDEEGREVQVHRSGAGKSGGQRQKLTATCLAAALRYQLGGPGRVLPTFATVFLDEAFDKADADFTDAAMKIFKSFGFQLIIATPVKSVMTIEPYVGGAVFVHIKDRKDSRALVLPYDEETQRIDYRPIEGPSTSDEES